MELKDVPKATLVKLSESLVVASYFIGFDTEGIVIVWKLRFANGTDKTFHLAPGVAVFFTKGTLEAERRYKWPRTENWPQDMPEMTVDDWDGAKREFGTVNLMRCEAFSDTVICVLQFVNGKGLHQAFRIPPELAVQMAVIHHDAIQSGKLRDIEAEPPASTTRN